MGASGGKNFSCVQHVRAFFLSIKMLMENHVCVLCVKGIYVIVKVVIGENGFYFSTLVSSSTSANFQKQAVESVAVSAVIFKLKQSSETKIALTQKLFCSL